METNVDKNRTDKNKSTRDYKELHSSEAHTNSDLFELSVNELSNVEQVENDESSNNDKNNDTCFICLDGNDEQQLSYAKVCCGTTIYHNNCMKEYCEKEITNKKKKKVTCQICHNDITDKINIEIIHKMSCDKVIGWTKAIIWAGVVVLSCIFYAQIPQDKAAKTGLILTYIFGPVISFYMMLNSTRRRGDLLYEKSMEALFTIEVFINPLILLCTSLIVINYPNKLSNTTANHIFIIIGCGSIGAYVILWYLCFCLKKCVHIPEMLSVCFAQCTFLQARICFTCFSCVTDMFPLCFSCIMETSRECCMDDSVQYSVKNEFVSNDNNGEKGNNKKDNSDNV